MRTWIGAAILLTVCGVAPLAGASEGQNTDMSQDQIRQLLEKINALEQRVKELEDPAAPAPAEPAPAAGLEDQLDEVIHQSPASPVREPTRLNLTAPGLDGVEVSANYWARGEKWVGFPFTNTGGRDNINSFGQSIDLNFRFRLSETTSIYTSVGDRRIWGSDSVLVDSDEDQFALNQGFVQFENIYDTGSDLRVGRQIIELGAERQIGNDDWLLQENPFDAARIDRPFGENSNLTFLFARLLDSDQTFGNEFFPGGAAGRTGEQENADMYSFYYTNRTDVLGDVDLYLIYLDADDGTGLDTQLFTYGARWRQGVGPVWWEVEGAHQAGEILGMHTDYQLSENFAFYTRAGIDLMDSGVPLLGGVWAGWDMAKGDSNGTGEPDQYVQLFPQLHGWFGIMDLASWSNVHHYVVGLDLNIYEGKLTTAYHILRSDTNGQAFGGYNAALGNVNSEDVGHEFDVVYSRACTENTDVSLGTGYFFPGDAFQDQTSSSSGQFFGYLQFGLNL